MFRGMTIFVCDNCGYRFKGPDLEFMATVYSTPQRCSKCGSWHTFPGGLGKTFLSYFHNRAYRSIWRSLDELQDRDGDNRKKKGTDNMYGKGILSQAEK